MRIDSPGARSYTILDIYDSTEVTISPSARTVTRKTTTSGDLLTTPALVLRPEATGEVDHVAGYPCEIYRYRLSVADMGDCCMVTGIPHAVDAHDGSTSGTAASGDLFSLRTRAIGPAGEERSRSEVSKIERTTLDPSLFVVPPGYRTVPAPGLQR